MPHTNRLGLPGPARNFAAHRSRALTNPTPVCASALRSDRHLGDLVVGQLGSDPLVDTMRGMALLPRRVAVSLENAVDIKRKGPITGRSRETCLRSGGSAL